MNDRNLGADDGSRGGKRRAWPLIAVGALFLGPFIVALLLYAGRESFGGFDELPNPDRELIADPAVVPLEPLNLADGSRMDPDWARSRWSLIYGSFGPCDADCAAALDRLDRVWLALGGERDRVRRLLLMPGDPGGSVVPEGFTVGFIDADGGDALAAALGLARLEQGRYFVVDPLGNVILSYPDNADQGRLLEDLKRLLEVSRVG